MGKPIRDSKGKFAGSEGEGKKKVPTAGPGKPSTAPATDTTSASVDYDSQYSRFNSANFVPSPNWKSAFGDYDEYDDDEHVMIENPYESFSGYIEITPEKGILDERCYIARVHRNRVDDTPGGHIDTSDEFSTLEEAQAWAENWRQ